MLQVCDAIFTCDQKGEPYIFFYPGERFIFAGLQVLFLFIHPWKLKNEQGERFRRPGASSSKEKNNFRQHDIS